MKDENNITTNYGMIEGIFIKYYSYFDGKFISKLKNLELATKIMIIILAINSIIIGFLTIAVITLSLNKVVQFEITNNTQAGVYWITPNDASEDYFKMIAQSHIGRNTNFSFLNIEDKVNDLLKYVDKSTYINSKALLQEDLNFIVANNISQTFTPDNWEVKKKGRGRAIVIVTGNVNKTVGNIQTLKNVEYQYEIELIVDNYIAYVKYFIPLCTDTGVQMDNKSKAKRERKRIKNEKRLEDRSWKSEVK